MLIKHKHLTGQSIHAAHAFEYSDRAARLAATGFDITEIGRLAIQVDTGGYWRIAAIDPVEWVPAYGNSMFQRLQAEEVTDIIYDENDKVTQTTYGNGVYCTVEYNVNDKAEFISFFNSEDTLLEKWEYAYDEHSRLTSVTQTT